MPSSLLYTDQHLLLALNGSDSTWLDNVMLTITSTTTWIPLILVLLYVLFKNRHWREVLLFIVCLALVILITDRFSSGFCKPFFHRLRPSHEPALEGLVDLVGDRRGGLYGFISSHAANTFGAWMFISLYFRRRSVTWTVLLWACLSSYSRIYLGLHYPGDIFCGALWGVFTGGIVYLLLIFLHRHFFSSSSIPPSVAAGFVSDASSTEVSSSFKNLLLIPASFAITLLFVALSAFL